MAIDDDVSRLKVPMVEDVGVERNSVFEETSLIHFVTNSLQAPPQVGHPRFRIIRKLDL